MCKPKIEDKDSTSILDESTLTAETTTTTTNAKRKGRMVPQVAACIAASLGTLASGAVNGWTASTLPSLQQDIHMGTIETALMVGIIGVGAILGSLIAGRIMDCMGRRKTIVLANPVLVVAWIFMAVVPNIYLVLLGRFTCGLMTSFLFSSVSVYCSEIPEARVRGSLGTISSFFITLGVVLSYITGAFLPWRHSCYVCAAPPLLSMVTMLAMPESPYWLMLKDRRGDAETALKWLRGPHYDINEDLESVATKLKAVGTKSEYRELLRPRTRRPFFISLFLMTLQQGSGSNILMMYTSNIFISVGIEDHHMPTVYTGLVQVVGTIGSVLLMDRLGRRTLIVASITTVGMFTITLGVYYYLGTVGVSWPQAMPLLAMLMSVFGYSLGCRTIPWLATSELFNTTIRSRANTICLFYNRILNFVIIQIYPFVAEAAGPHIVFFFFGAFSLVLGVLAFFILPETRGKSLEQIQDYFEEKSKKASKRNTKTSTGKDEDSLVEERTISHKVDTLLSSHVSVVPSDAKLTVVTERGEMTRF
ncbi:facilitated trehalose transporter Tret1-like [Portunus trituberculatus]|uniref:facilitated trehalose transporter Tret1-like n=1 Tax=Portunus trituberculatus TaxID=210409 RepID=UPI001E1CDC7E|nr:facilitated trehalose transporter Tret1-like [Portunus trituberculatus]